MKELTSNTIGLLAATLLAAALVSAQEAETLKDALAKGDASVDLRYRYELVDDGNFEKDAHASTLRTALGYRTLAYKGFSLFIQVQNVAPIFKDDKYDNAGAGHLWNEVDDRPVVADPAQTRMQQVYLRINAFDTAFDFGRREITQSHPGKRSQLEGLVRRFSARNEKSVEGPLRHVGPGELGQRPADRTAWITQLQAAPTPSPVRSRIPRRAVRSVLPRWPGANRILRPPFRPE